MSTRRTGFLRAVAVVVGCFAAGFPSVVAADPCWLLTDEASVKSASDLIFIGTAVAKAAEIFEAVELEGREYISAEKTTFKIESVDKGDIKPGDEVRGEKGEKCSCAGKFEIGKKYVVHARLSGSENVPTLHFCDFNKKLD